MKLRQIASLSILTPLALGSAIYTMYQKNQHTNSEKYIEFRNSIDNALKMDSASKAAEFAAVQKLDSFLNTHPSANDVSRYIKENKLNDSDNESSKEMLDILLQKL